MSFLKRRPSNGSSPVTESERQSVLASDVFTPAMPAWRGFVGRGREIKDLTFKGLRVPGMQIVVWGESGAGKSSLINKALLAEGRAAVSTSCTPESTFEGILSDALVSTGAFYVSERGEDSDGSFSASIQGGGEIIGAKGKLEERLAQRASVKKQLIAPPDMTVRTLFYALGQYNLSWVIEDYHKMSTKERGRLAHALKVFSDHGGAYRHTQVIILGVAESVDELVGGSANLANRVMDVQVPPLSKSELGEILDLGGKILNVDFSVVRARLIEMSVGTASITGSSRSGV